MSTAPPTTAPATAPTTPPTTRDRWFVGSLVRILADAADTNGQLGVFEQTARKNFSPPRHVHHREDTALFVIEGKITVEIGDERRTADAGELVWLPKDVPHTFRVDSEQARLLELITPGGFETYHVDASDPAPFLTLPPVGPPDVGRLVAAIGPYGAELVGPPMDSADAMDSADSAGSAD